MGICTRIEDSSNFMPKFYHLRIMGKSVNCQMCIIYSTILHSNLDEYLLHRLTWAQSLWQHHAGMLSCEGSNACETSHRDYTPPRYWSPHYTLACQQQKHITYTVSHAYVCCALTTSVVHFPSPTLDDSNKVHRTPVGIVQYNINLCTMHV